jgi:pyruvate dehydrogenase E2 component (dihydrolipoamide acetyltransferase)
MPFEFTMPFAYDSMTDGLVGKWFVREGDFVPRGSIICEVETDKIVGPCELRRDGTLASVLVPAGGRAAVGATLAVFALSGESVAEVRRRYAPAAHAAAAPPARHKRKRPSARRLLLNRLRRWQP